MGAIDKITTHYAANERQSLLVPEWDLTVYWKLLTVAERRRLVDAPGKTDVDVLIAHALDADGNRMFTAEHKPVLLRKADATIVTRVAVAILGGATGDRKDVDDSEKN